MATDTGTATGTTTTSTTTRSTRPCDDGEIDGRAVRAAKDTPGRHGAGYYGTRDSVQPERPQPRSRRCRRTAGAAASAPAWAASGRCERGP